VVTCSFTNWRSRHTVHTTQTKFLPMPKVLNDVMTNVFEVDLLIVIISITYPLYQVLAFSGTRGSTKFEYAFDFPSSFRYFTRLFVVTTRKVHRIVFTVRFNLADVEGIVNERKLTIR